MAEYESSGIWVIEQVGPFRHSGVDYDWLSLPPELAEQFRRWIITYWAYYDQAMFDEEYPEFKGFIFDTESFNQEGRELAHQLKAHLGPECYVEFQPESNEGGGLGTAEIISL